MINLKDYKIIYKDNKSIEFNDIVIENGEFVGLSGDSGCGKTSLLNSLFGYNFTGSIFYTKAEILGKDIKALGKEKYKFISYNPQFSQDALNPKICIKDHIDLTISSNNIKYDEERIKAALDSLNLKEELLKSYPYMLSGGQKQRIVLLLSVIKNPRLLVLDEPSSAIDALTLKIIVEFLNKIREQRTIIMVSHNYEFLNKLSDRVIKLS